MHASILFKPVLQTFATVAALAGLAMFPVAAGATALTVPAAPHKATGFAAWPMFRDGPAHLGVSPETAISTATASTLTAGWTASVGTSSYSSPAVATLKALGKPVVFVGGSSSLSAYPASGGAPLWTFPVSKAVDSSPAVYNGVVYFASANGTLYALNAATGAPVWHVLPKAGTYASPAISGPPGQQVLITGALSGHLFALNPATGKTLWTQQPSKAAYWSSPTISQGTIYITSKNGQLLTFAPAGG